MNILKIGLVIFSVTCLLFITCKKFEEPVLKPRLFITLKDDSGANIAGARVRLYKNAQDSGSILISDTSGIVFFQDLEPELYYWHAAKGCSTNRNSQNTVNRPLIVDVVLYGNSVLSETGTLKITNTATEPYKVSSSFFNITLSRDTPFIVYPKIGAYTVHSEKLSTPGIGRDTSVQVRCGDTTFIILP
ncbi:MAG TPA: hypothetical protein VGO58_11805 [Chitinophagaceae bacterium]|jgi:hypothetical protein|nr:hypothetical protein [Chitinophagaceae bacterium]